MALDTHFHLAFHASSVVVDDKAILFAGDGGIGKSTIAEMLEAEGYQVPGDEVAFISMGTEGIWQLGGSIKKINGEYEFFEMDRPPKLELVVFLRKHQKSHYTLEPCKSARAVKQTFRLLFCDRLNDPHYLLDAFRWTSSIFRQSRGMFLDFSKSLDFFPDVIRNLKGDE